MSILDTLKHTFLPQPQQNYYKIEQQIPDFSNGITTKTTSSGTGSGYGSGYSGGQVLGTSTNIENIPYTTSGWNWPGISDNTELKQKQLNRIKGDITISVCENGYIAEYKKEKMVFEDYKAMTEWILNKVKNNDKICKKA